MIYPDYERLRRIQKVLEGFNEFSRIPKGWKGFRRIQLIQKNLERFVRKCEGFGRLKKIKKYSEGSIGND